MFAAVLALSLIPLPPPDPTRPRVRPLDDLARTIVASGVEASSTVRELLAAVEASDVVVYIQTAANMRDRGALGFVAHGSPLTYVLIRINVTQGTRDRIATLAHELTHAVEVAEASPPVRSEPDLAALYKRIGFRTRPPHEFESARARANERQARTDQTSAAALPGARPEG